MGQPNGASTITHGNGPATRPYTVMVQVQWARQWALLLCVYSPLGLGMGLAMGPVMVPPMDTSVTDSSRNSSYQLQIYTEATALIAAACRRGCNECLGMSGSASYTTVLLADFNNILQNRSWKNGG